MRIELRDKELELQPGELVIIPRGIEHRPVADSEVSVMLIEPKGTINIGDEEEDVQNKKSTTGEWI